jgi:hypothetical protein
MGCWTAWVRRAPDALPPVRPPLGPVRPVGLRPAHHAGLRPARHARRVLAGHAPTWVAVLACSGGAAGLGLLPPLLGPPAGAPAAVPAGEALPPPGLTGGGAWPPLAQAPPLGPVGLPPWAVPFAPAEQPVPAPEPSGLAVLLGGCAVLLGLRRRRCST